MRGPDGRAIVRLGYCDVGGPSDSPFSPSMRSSNRFVLYPLARHPRARQIDRRRRPRARKTGGGDHGRDRQQDKPGAAAAGETDRKWRPRASVSGGSVRGPDGRAMVRLGYCDAGGPSLTR